MKNLAELENVSSNVITRNNAMDIIKFIAIVLVVYGHAVQYLSEDGVDSGIYKAIYLFHMPLFMMISGYFYASSLQKYSVRHIIFQKIKTLLLPCVVLKLFYILFHGYNIHDFSWVGLTYNLWFLKSLFICSILGLCMKGGKIFGAAISLIVSFYLYYAFPVFFGYLLLPQMYISFLTGYCLKKIDFTDNKSINKDIAITMITILFAVIVAEILGIEKVRSNPIHKVIWFGIPISILIVYLVSSVEKKVSKRLIDRMAYCGHYTKEIYILQSVVLERWIASTYPFWGGGYYIEILGPIVVTILVLLLLIPLCSFLAKNKYTKYLLGDF